MRILVVEDDEVLADGLRVGLRLAGFTPDHVSGIEDARAALETAPYAAMVLDLMLPDGSGLTLLKDLRRQGAQVPVLVLTARDQTRERIAGLDAGADDYMGKPFDLDELAARLRVLIRRGQGRSAQWIEYGALRLDPSGRRAQLAEVPLNLSRREFALLQALVEWPGRILSKRDLEDRLYGWDDEIESNAVEVHVHHLRAKLGRSFIETVRGIGYRVPAPGSPPSPSASAFS
jgi:two-component system response regulator QseB